MKLSIITINLNNASGLEKTAESIVSQTFNDFEWIVIDGGSTDGSVDVIRKYADSIAYWVSEKDSGIYNAMNKGVKVAKGEYLQFLNSGDWLADDSVLQDVFSRHLSGEIIYGNINCYKDLRFCSFTEYPAKLSLDFLLLSAIGHGASFINHSLLLLNPYDERYRIVSDWKFFLVEKLKGSSFEHIDRCVCCYDLSGISSTMLELRDKERNAVTEALSSKIIEYKIIQSRDVSSFLANVSQDEFIEICRSHPILRKVITAVVLLMKRK